MFRTEKKSGASALLLACVLLSSVTACGGGGGGSSASPPPPPAPSPPTGNSPPTVTVSVDQAPVDEGQSFIIDATGSSDSDGDALSFEIRQTGGQTLTQTSAGSGVYTYQTPHVDTDEDVVFAITVSDGTVSEEASVTVTIRNYARTPLSGQWGNEVERVSTGYPVRQLYIFFDDFHVVLQHETAKLGVYFEDLRAGPGGLAIADAVVELDVDESAGEVQFLFDDFDLNTRTDMAVMSPATSRIDTYLNVDDGAGGVLMQPSGGADVSGVCAIQSARVWDDRPNVSANEYSGIVAGTDGNGITVLLNDGNPRNTFNPSPNAGQFSTSRSLTTSGSACAITRQTSVGPSGGYEVYAYDPVRRELVGYREPVTSAAELTQTISLNMPATGMELVGMEPGIGNHGQGFLALLFSDGEHAGNQALIIIQFVNGLLEQATIMLPNGVPTGMLVGAIDNYDPDNPPPPGYGDYDSDIVIAVPETPYVYVLENLSNPYDPLISPANAGSVTFSELHFFEVGYGVTDVSGTPSSYSILPGLVTGDADGEVVIYSNTDPY